MESVFIQCPSCQQCNEIPKIYRGRTTKCVVCQEEIKVPLNQATHKSTANRSSSDVLPMLFAGLIVIGGLTYCNLREDKAAPIVQESPEQALRVATRVWVSQNIADPDAEIVEMNSNLQTQGDDPLVVQVTLRGENALGGYRIQSYRLLLDPSGEKVIHASLIE